MTSDLDRNGRMSDKDRPWTVLVAATSLLLVLGGALVALAQSVNPQIVRWGGVISIESQTPTYVAMDQGYFRDEGLRIDKDRLVLTSGGRLREALAAGEVDFAELATFTYILGRAKGLKQKAILELYSREWVSMFVREGLRNQVKSVADLKGLKIAITSPGASTHSAALWYLSKSGLKESDVQFVALQSADPAIYITSFETGRVDAGVVWEPLATTMVERKSAFPLVDLRDVEVHRKWFGDRASAIVLTTSEDMIQKQPDVVQRAVNAVKKGLAFIGRHSDREIATAAASRFGMDSDLYTRIIRPLRQNFRDGAISRAGMAVEVELMLAGGAIDRRLSYEEMVEPRFAGSAE